MHKLVPAIVLCYMFLIAFLLVQTGEAHDKHRNKRHLAFLNSTKFYLKFNFKANVIPWNQLFAQAIGFRMNWEIPPMTFPPFRTMYRRHVYDFTEDLLDKNGFSGFHCLRRTICEMQMIAEPYNLYHKLLKIVFSQHSTTTKRWHNATEEECQASITSCPLSLLEILPYTDLG